MLQYIYPATPIRKEHPMNIQLFKKLGMTFGAISTIVALYVEIHEMWAKKELEKE